MDEEQCIRDMITNGKKPKKKKAFDIDPETGLPVLPAGRFFRVRKHYMRDYIYSIEIRERTRFGSRLLWWVMLNDVLTEDEILKGANSALAGYTEALKEPVTNEGLLGDYPPRKI